MDFSTSRRLVLRVVLTVFVCAPPASIALARPAAEVHAAANLTFADSFGSFEHVLVPALGVDLLDTKSHIGGRVLIDLPRTISRQEPGRIKSGPVTYVLGRRDWAASFLVRGEVTATRRLGLLLLGGLGVMGVETFAGYSGQPLEEIPRTRRTGPAFCGGFDVRVHARRMVFAAPQVRIRYFLGDPSERAPNRSIWSIGAAIGLKSY